jgi:hypothetical protein
LGTDIKPVSFKRLRSHDDPYPMEALAFAPFCSSLAILRGKAPIVLYSTDILSAQQRRYLDQDVFLGCAIIHELGHICVHGTVEDKDEYDFFGWEYALAKKLDIVEEWLSPRMEQFTVKNRKPSYTSAK